jgi:phospholipid/cholesterol/gamma-HCH transport system substrate-binding protein
VTWTDPRGTSAGSAQQERRGWRERCRRLLAGAVVGAAAIGLAACGSAGSSATVSVHALFSDVSSLTTGASVEMADVPVGSVTGIRLHGDQALVTMSVRRSAHVPADVVAKLEQTTILGEYVIDLVPGAVATGSLRNGQTITDAQVVPGLQQLVQAGTEVFGAISASELSSLIDNSAVAFGGQGPQLHALLDDFATVLHGYSTQTAQITSLIDRIDQFSSGLAPDAQANAQAITNLAQATSVLAAQSNQFVALLQSLDTLASQTRAILDTGLPDIETQVASLQATAEQLAANQTQLAELLQVVPAANANLAAGSYQHEVQVLNNIIVCGVPGLGEGTAPTNTCTPNGSGS